TLSRYVAAPRGTARRQTEENQYPSARDCHEFPSPARRLGFQISSPGSALPPGCPDSDDGATPPPGPSGTRPDVFGIVGSVSILIGTGGISIGARSGLNPGRRQGTPPGPTGWFARRYSQPPPSAR